MYAAFKHIHMLCALISIIGFITRSIWAFQGSALLQKKLVKILPHIVDTLLIISAIVLAVNVQQYPFINNWLTAKVLALVAYIVFGVLTLKKAKNNQQRAIYFVLALSCFFYIAGVAVSKNPAFFL